MNILNIDKDGEYAIKEDTIILSKAKVITTILEENVKVILITLNKDTTTKTILKGNHSEQKTISLFKANNEDVNIYNISDHVGKNTFSLIETKGVIQKSNTTTRGLVRINSDADDSEGYQKSDVLVLDDSKVTSVPDLEINNHNVKCSHGATISQIDKEKKFYLMSRGLNEEEAQETLITGFFEPIINELPEEVKETIRNELK